MIENVNLITTQIYVPCCLYSLVEAKSVDSSQLPQLWSVNVMQQIAQIAQLIFHL